MRFGQDIPRSRAQAGCPGRVAETPHLGDDLNDVVSPRTRTTHIARPTLPLRTWRPFIQSPGCASLGPSGVGNRVSLPIAGLGRCRIPSRSSRNFGQHPGLVAINGCAATFISLRRNDPWQDATQDCAESLGFAASIIGVRHAKQHGEVDDQEGVPAFQGCGNAN